MRSKHINSIIKESIYSESGRSLTEMLGVLAIMGILTIGGIAGFNYAMNKQRANATVNYVNQLAVLGTGQMLAGGTPKLLDYPDHTPSGYPAKITTDTNAPNAFYVEIDEVPTPVCNEIISRLDGWKMVNDIGFFNGVGACADQEKVGMWFEITANATKGKTDYHCATNQDCKTRFGNNYTCGRKGTCELTCQSGYTKTASGCCPNKRVFNGGCCPKDLEDGKCCGRINIALTPEMVWTPRICCPAGTFMIYDRTTKTAECISCDTPDAKKMVQSGDYTVYCQVCPNRSINGFICAPKDECSDPEAVNVNGKCYCPISKPLIDTQGNCHDCDWGGTNWENRVLHQNPYEMIGLDRIAIQYYCNRRGRSGYLYPCDPGTIALSKGMSLINADGETYTEQESTSCFPCENASITDIKYESWCESCGGKWVGKAWDKGLCTP